jgi:hypothetical protein
MIVFRAVFLEFLLCFHVIGAAVLFRRLFPKESAWLGFFVPILVVMSALNFVEHFIALPNLGWLLPITMGGLIWAMATRGRAWSGLALPSVLFVVTFSFVFLLKCLSPDIPNYTEGIGNLTRILNYALGGTLPPTDSFLPPYDYGGYYSFQQYGAALLMRLFSLDIGTAYNLSFAFLLAWMCLAGAAVAYSISGKSWIACAMVMMLLACMTGSVPIDIVFGHHGLDFGVVTDLNDVWNDKDRNPFWAFSSSDVYHPNLKLLPPAYTLYYSEFHANLGGSFVTMAALFAAMEVFKPERGNWPWIALVVLPMMCLITSAWFFLIILFFCAGSLFLATVSGRRPLNVAFAAIGAAAGVACLWPSVQSILQNPATQDFHWTHVDERTPLWMFALQWWPVYLPWFFLCFVWDRLDLRGRWIHFALAVLMVAVEFCTFGDRGLTTEKMWGELFGAGTVTLLPYLFIQRGIFFRVLTVFFVAVHLFSLGGWIKAVYYDPLDPTRYFHIEGNYYMESDSQVRRLLEVLKRLHGATILPGKSYWAYNEAPGAVSFSGNRCFVAYFHQEAQVGHQGEAEYRSSLNNSFYRGEMADPLPFLRENHIAAVLIWPDDKIPDDLLQKLQSQIGSEFFYINCKGDGQHNAGVFMRVSKEAVPAATPPAPLDLSPLPPPDADSVK